MILLVGIPTEPMFAMVAAELDRIGGEFRFVNQRHAPKHHLQLKLENEGLSGVIDLDGEVIPLSSVTGFYDRATDPRSIPEIASLPADHNDVVRAQDFHEKLSAYMQCCSSVVVNRNRPMATNASKPGQAQVIRRFFDVPETLVTNDAETVRDFLEGGDAIYKSVSGERSIVMKCDLSDIERLRHLWICPVQFQRQIKGNDCRVHVVGDSVFACMIDSDGVVDYRYAHTKHGIDPTMTAVTLPEQWRRSCIELTRSFGLEFSGIDFVIDCSGRPWCLEVNTSPAYSYFENEAGLPIAASLARLLSGADVR